MTERVVIISAPNIVANKVTYVNQVVNTATPELVTNVVVSGVSTNVTTDTVNFVFTGIGEESIPNPTLFKRSQEYVSALDAPSITTSKTFADSLNTADSFNVLVQYSRIFEETKTTSEVVDKFVGKGLVDLGDVSDQNLNSVYKTVLDSVINLDTKTITISKQLLETVQNLDQSRISVSKLFVESKSVADTFSRTVNYKRSFSDSVDATDDFLGEANIDDDQTARIGKNTIDYASTSESKLFNVSVTKLDIAQAQDQKAINLTKIVSDSSVLQDQKYLEIDKVFLESKTLTDVVDTSILKTTLDITNTTEQTNKDTAKVVLDTGVVIDSTAKQLLVQHLDNTVIQDQVITQWNVARIFQETQQTTSQLPSFDISLTKLEIASVPDQVEKIQVKIFLDTSSLTDSFSVIVDFNRSFTDSINVTDDFLGEANIDDDQIARVGKVVVDTVTIPQILSFDSTKILLDSFSSTDTTYITTDKVAAEVIATSDVLTFQRIIVPILYEVITSSDSGFINNQSYFAGTYVEPGYVGTNTYFT
jgi:hypothetical protein